MTPEEFEEAVGRPLWPFAHQCHGASILLVKSGVLGPSRVARGTCPGVPGQHSWVVLGNDCYDPEATVLDPTLWSYTGEEPYIWEGKASERPHTPFGSGSIFSYGKPSSQGGPIITLEAEWSWDAERFLTVLEPLDREGWAQLAHAPVKGWPSKEILTAMYHDERVKHLVPIDIYGMATDLNPGDLYLAELPCDLADPFAGQGRA